MLPLDVKSSSPKVIFAVDLYSYLLIQTSTPCICDKESSFIQGAVKTYIREMSIVKPGSSSMVGSAVPTPGGAAGAFHAATGGALVILGVELEKAAAIAIVLHLVDFAPAALFGLFYFLRGDINVARLRASTSASAVEHAVEDEKVAVVESA